MIDCLDVYPQRFETYQINKATLKQELRPHMRRLLAELEKPKVFAAFLEKSLFDGGNADYLSIYVGPASTPFQHKCFHIFYKTDVVTALAKDLTPANSQARNHRQTSEQKVVLKSALLKKQIGEIEDRHDSSIHYREMKFRLNGKAVFNILKENISVPSPNKARPCAITYGRAVKLFQ